MKRFVFVLSAIAFQSAALAVNYTGSISMLEVWKTGNIAFSLSVPVSSCNGQFIVNASDPGFKNIYAAVLAAKKSGGSIMVNSGPCGAAENYGGSYNLVDYVYVID